MTNTAGTGQDDAIGQNNQIAADGNDTFTYDAERNRLTRTAVDGEVTEYVWDHRNRLVEVRTLDTAVIDFDNETLL